MSFARVLLHVVAALMPLVALDFAFALFNAGFPELRLSLSACAVAAAQLAALAGWQLLERCAHRPGRLWPGLVGLGMGLLTHVLFGVLAGATGAGPYPAGLEVVPVTLTYIALSLFFVGWLSLPLLTALALLLHGLRREELALAST